jgi:hypothetical protein
MPAYFCRQPNGLICRFSTVVDCVTDHNMTNEDYLNFKIEEARQQATENISNPNYFYDYSETVDMFVPNNMTKAEHLKLLKEMESAKL